jgi:hypothetical protein
MAWFFDAFTFLENHNGAVTAIATIVLTATTVVYAWLTGILARETRRLRRAGTEPDVVAYLLPDALHLIPINLVIANVGSGPARNVAIEIEADADDFAAHRGGLRIDAFPVGVRRPMLSIMPQGERLAQMFGMGPELFEGGALKDFKIKVHFENFNGVEKTNVSVASIKMFEGFGQIGTPPELEVAQALKKIADEIGNWGSGFRRLKVETVTQQEEAETARKRRQEQMDAKKPA